MSTATPILGEVEYPTSDGKPMAESDLHILVLSATRQLLINHFASDPNIYVSGNNLMYYERGNPRKSVSPDVYLVHGIPKKLRDLYLVWEEGKGPDVVIEITSKTTRREDLNSKMALYRDVLKVPEYFLFDPRREYLKTSLKGHRLIGQEYMPIDLSDGRLPSEQLALHLEPQGTNLRFWDPVRKEYLLTSDEQLERQSALLERERTLLERERALLERYRQQFGPLPPE